MEAAKKRIHARHRKKAHIRKRIFGTAECPRLSVFRSAKHVYVQAIDDVERKTIVSISSQDKDTREKINGYTGNKTSANIAGKLFGEKLQGNGISKAVFDRNGFLYHGRVKSLADGIREVGIKF